MSSFLEKLQGIHKYRYFSRIFEKVIFYDLMKNLIKFTEEFNEEFNLTRFNFAVFKIRRIIQKNSVI